MTYQHQILSGISGLKSLESQWRGLHPSCEHWARFELYRAYVESLQNDSDVFWIHISDARETLAIIPTILSSRQTIVGRVRTVSFGVHSEIPLWDMPLASHADPVMVRDAMLRALSALPTKWDALHWPRILQSSNAHKIASQFRGAIIRQGGLSNYFDTPPPFAELSQRFSENIRGSLRKARNKLRTVGWSVTVGDTEADFGEFLAVEASGWKGAAGMATAVMASSKEDFYRALLRQKGKGFVPEVVLLRVDGKAIAAQFSVFVHGCKQVLKIGYDEARAKLSPGQVLLEWALEGACSSSSIDRLSFVTDMPWHYTWRPSQEAVMIVLLFRNELLGPTYRAYLATRQTAQQARTIVAQWRKSPPPNGAGARQK